MSLIHLGDVPAIPCRCSRCARVRTGGSGADWQDHPAKLSGEVLGMCATCAELLRRLEAQRYAREGRLLRRQRAKSYGPGKGDPFAGFREES